MGHKVGNIKIEWDFVNTPFYVVLIVNHKVFYIFRKQKVLSKTEKKEFMKLNKTETNETSSVMLIIWLLRISKTAFWYFLNRILWLYVFSEIYIKNKRNSKELWKFTWISIQLISDAAAQSLQSCSTLCSTP